MNFSPSSLLKLQRLARTIKKELNLPLKLASQTDIGEMLSRAAKESNNPEILKLYSDFISTLTDQDKLELSDYNILKLMDTQQQVDSGEPTEQDISENEEKQEFGSRKGMYRGQAIYAD